MAQLPEEVPILVAQAGPLNGQRWPILNQLVIGREDDCDIVIPERQVSRHHARLTSTSAGIILEDLASKNGTHHNGTAITQPVVLQDGDMIQIALAQSFFFISSDATLPLEQASQLPVLTGDRALKLDKRARRVWIRQTEIIPPLSGPQFRLLEILYDRQDQVVSRSELIEAIWGEKEAIVVSEQALDALIRRLRERISEIDPEHEYVQTIRGHGLRMDNPLS